LIKSNFRASNGDDSCITDYLVLPGGHCKEDVASHYSTDRFCGNQMGFQGISQPIVQYTAPFILQVRIWLHTFVLTFDVSMSQKSIP